MRTSTRLALVLMVASGCGGDDDGGGGGGGVLDDIDPGVITGADDMETWASASAPNVFVSAYLPITMAELALEEGGDCPVMTEDGDTVTYEGDCTDADGNTWIGRATTAGDMESPSATVTYEGFGFQSDEDCDGATVPSELAWTGSIELSSSGELLSMAIDVAADGSSPGADCEPFPTQIGIDYELTMDDSGEQNLWNGSGRVGNSLYGRVDATTEDELVDSSVCDSEALSGTTTVTAGDDVAVVTYDGADDCDEESTVTWTHNGEDQGELVGVECAAGGAAGGGAPAILLALLVLAGRRSRLTPR